ncbi:hypothetical protein [Ascidiimonas aurantiaca]|uniref:hypothetical protein n=1 Tax=Ascidiimonas aurantiaca TaxID=1685432 RepID=UPI0030EE81CB
MKIKNLLILVLALGLLSGCSFRLVDFTVISSKNVSLDIDRAEGKKVEGKKSYFLGIGWNIKDAMDEALEKAGPEYDLLVDGVVRYGSYPFVASVTVEGTAVSSKDMKNKLGETGFKDWLNGKKLTYDKQTEVVYTEKKK